MKTGLNSRESFSFGAMPSPNIPDLAKTRQDLPLRDIRIGAFDPLLYGNIIHGSYLTKIHYTEYVTKKTN